MTGPSGPQKDASDANQPVSDKRPPAQEEQNQLSLGDLVSRQGGLEEVRNSSRLGRSQSDTGMAQQAAHWNRFVSGRSIARGLTEELRRELTRDAQGQPFTPRSFKAEPPQMNREFTWSARQGLDQSANQGLNFPIGLRQYFQLRKSEFQPIEEKPATELLSRVDKLLNETPVKEDNTRTPAEERELLQSREALQNSKTSDEALSKALHLARLYQHLRYIEDAQRAMQFALGIDPDNIVGKQLFKELERMHPVDIGVSSAPLPVPASVTKSALRKRIHDLSRGRIMVVGDLLIDELLEGKPERISREAPVLILEHVDTVLIPGGASNTANNVVALGGQCHAVGVCGADDYAQKMADMLTRHHIRHSLVPDVTRPTTVKTRILSKSHSLMQQLLRLDRISHHPISPMVERAVVQKIRETANNYDAIILSDYRAGVITDGVIEACREMASYHHKQLIVDAQGNFERFRNATLLTPNQPDAEKAVGFQINSKETLERAGAELLAATNAEAVLITRGPEGMVLFRKDQQPVEMPVFNRSDVFDVTGAGDTVVATMALALVTGATPVEAMALGNLAAGIVVRKSGTAVTSQKEMIETLEQLNIAET
ncbi:MAG TPA: bifunctional ADP-heptose synthase [Candidatus Obscuribacterales bacterium]